MPRRSGLPILVCIGVAVLFSVPAAAQPRCARMAEPSVRLEVEQAEPALDTVPGAELQRLVRETPGEHAQALGLYRGELRTGLRLEYSVVTQGAGACVGLHRAVIEIAFVDRTIVLARELRQGTCRYDVALEHERQHARIDDRVLARELPKIKDAIAREAADNGVIGPVRASDIDSYRDDFSERLNRVFQREIDRIGQARRHEQAQIDTPEAYRREAERCPGGLARD
jgi:hypothetical protein